MLLLTVHLHERAKTILKLKEEGGGGGVWKVEMTFLRSRIRLMVALTFCCITHPKSPYQALIIIWGPCFFITNSAKNFPNTSYELCFFLSLQFKHGAEKRKFKNKIMKEDNDTCLNQA
jgi:hypothetical protein